MSVCLLSCAGYWLYYTLIQQICDVQHACCTAHADAHQVIAMLSAHFCMCKG